MFNLDPVNQYRLEKAPLVQALVQVRFPLIAKIRTTNAISVVQEALENLFPYMDRAVETEFTFTSQSDSEATTEQKVSWHFTDDDQRLLVLDSTTLTFSVRGEQYEGVRPFTDTFMKTVGVLGKTLGIRRCDRIGVRFLDLIPDVDTPARWKDWFKPDVIGWSTSEIVEGNTVLQSTISQSVLSATPKGELSVFPSDVKAVIRHGVAGKGSIVPGIPPVTLSERSFLLDMDIFIDKPQPFDISSIETQVGALHSQADRFFRWTLTSAGEREFGLEEL
jgi:uncharacterized protein (TIGR04255 family)